MRLKLEFTASVGSDSFIQSANQSLKEILSSAIQSAGRDKERLSLLWHLVVEVVDLPFLEIKSN